MATIYQKNGQSLYDFNGQTFDAKTGQVVGNASLSGTGTPSPSGTPPQGLPDGSQPSPYQLPDTKPTGNPLIDFKNAIAAIDSMAKQNRNSFAGSLAGAVPEGTLNASSFGDIIQMLNKGGNDYASKTAADAVTGYNATLPKPADTITSTNDNGDVTGIDKNTGKVLWTVKGVGNKQTGASGADASNKPLDALDVGRYMDLHPEAGIDLGDTPTTALAKIKAANTPEAKLRTQITAFQNSDPNHPKTYEDTVTEINNSASIKDKTTALKVAKDVYGVVDTPASIQSSALEDRITQMKAGGILKDGDIRYALRRQGVSQHEIDSSSVGSLIEQIGNFLFKN